MNTAALKVEADAASANSPVEIWIRPKGARRQAFYRQGSACTWREMSVPLADKALRVGKMPSGPMSGAAVVSRETERPAAHPMQAAFTSQAQSLNRDIDAMNAAARSSAS